MELSGYHKAALKIFGGVAEKWTAENPRLRMGLLRAHIYQRPEVYMASFLLTMSIGFVALFIPAMFLLVLFVTGAIDVPANLVLLMVPAPFLLAIGIYIQAFLGPELRSASRARDIDAKLPYALNYVATMASAGVTPGKIFDSLSQQDVYGEIANEAALIRRDLQVIGLDIVTSLSKALQRSPSVRWADLLQGAITTLTSGGDLKDYFLNKSEQYLLDNRQEQKSFMESLGVLAESFVTVVVAAPLFLLVMLSVMTSFGADDQEMLMIGYVLILVLLPVAQAGFALTIKFITPEV